MRANTAIECHDAAWSGLAALGVVGTIVYSFGFPLLCCLLTHPARHAPPSSEQGAVSGGGGGGAEESGLAPRELAGVERKVARAWLLLRSYRPEYWWWESAEVLRKYFLTSVVLVVAPDTMLQVYLGLVVCVASAILVARHQPYADPLCGRVQMLALTQLAFTYVSGMLFFDDGSGRDLDTSASTFTGANGTAAAAGGMHFESDVAGEELDEDRWGAALVFVNMLVFALLAVGLCTAVDGSVREATEELAQAKKAEEDLTAELEAMKNLLGEPSPALRRARIGFEELRVGPCIGEGQFGAVFRAGYKGTPVAVKTMHAHHVGTAGRAAAFRDEVLLLLELRHPNIVQIIGG